MGVTCGHCGKPFQAKRSDARYCSSTCRHKARQARIAGDQASVHAPAPAAAGRLAEATRAELGTLADTADGILLLALAERIDVGAETSPALATLSKEYAARKAALTELRTPAANPHDELRALRERRRAG